MPRQNYRGKVIRPMNNGAIVKCETGLPKDYDQNADVYVPSSNLEYGLPLKLGDCVEFVLSSRDKNKPFASTAKRTRCEERSKSEVEMFLNIVTSDLIDASDEKVIKLIGCLVSWRAVCECAHLARRECDALLQIIVQLRRYRRNLRQHVDDFIRSLLVTPLFSSADQSPLAKMLKTLDHVRESTLLDTVKSALLLLLEAVPEKSRSTLKLVKSLVRNDGSMESFLVTVLEKALAGDTTDGSVNELEWHELPSVLSTNDLVSNSGNKNSSLAECQRLLPVRIRGAYDSVENYMDTYFRLLWADGFASLQKGVTELLSGKLDHRDMHVYHSVKLVGFCLSRHDDDVTLQLQVTHHNHLINWETTSALMFGNLLCLSSDGNFKDAVYATVAERDIKELKKKGLIKVFLLPECNQKSPADIVISLLTNSGRIIMVESPTYYRAYQPVFKSLQSMKLDELPFQDELVWCTPASKYSPYYERFILPHESQRRSIFLNLQRSLINSNASDENDHIPDSLYDRIRTATTAWNIVPDNSQLTAIAHALHRRVACIQGPPGTGKTFAGVLIARILLREYLNDHSAGPILVLTYKNHALDEFLKQLLRFYPNGVARVGGRCKDPELEQCTLSELKKTKGLSSMSRAERDNFFELKRQIDAYKEEIKKALSELHSKFTITWQSFVEFEPLENCRKLVLGFLQRKRRTSKLTQDQMLFYQLLQSGPPSDAFFKDAPVCQQAFDAWLPDPRLLAFIESNFVPSADQLDDAELLLTSGVAADQPKDNNDDDISDEDDEQEVERKFADVKASRNAKDPGNVPLNLKQLGQHCHRILNSAEKLVADKPISLYLSLDPWSLEPMHRILLIQWILLQQTQVPRQALNDLLVDYQRLCDRRRELEVQQSISILHQMAVVGMTITGASLYHELVAGLRCEITLVEEAAEILEPQLVAALGPWTRHLILIGDHQQLRPPVETYDLVKKYNFDISLMERLINNRLPYRTLTMQNRMRLEFANLLLDIYPDIKSNEARVLKNQAPLCMEKSMFFWDHNHEETKARSVTNENEANMVVQLALFFLRHGYNPSQVTILAAYQGQTGLIRRLTRQAQSKYPDLFPEIPNTSVAAQSVGATQAPNAPPVRPLRERLQVQTIDMYQGDENEIVIVSLVRCNQRHDAGFLKLLNRRCVAQSRAKCGMYFVGSTDTLASHNHWRGLIKNMANTSCVGGSITVCCPRHRDVTVMAADANQLPQGPFCKVPCKELMECGRHYCTQLCHPYHKHNKCTAIEPVRLIRCGHLTNKRCHEREEDVLCEQPCLEPMPCGLHACINPCNPVHLHNYCRAPVEFKFSTCPHNGNKLCSQNESEVKCNEEVSHEFPSCGHRRLKKCYQDGTKLVCREACTRQASCGHPCTNWCGKECVTPEQCDVCKEIKRVEEEKRRQEEERVRQVRMEQTRREIEEFKKKPLEDAVVRTELSPTGDKAHMYNKLKDMVDKYVQADHNWIPEVTKIEEVTNYKLELKWLESKLKMFDSSYSDLKFHGTSAENVENIIKNGFLLPSKKAKNMFGRGVYFATDSSKSAQKLYTKGSNMLLVCDVLLGKPLTVDQAMTHLDAHTMSNLRCDSLYAKRDTKGTGGVKYDEYVVYDPARALPKYIVHYKSTSTATSPTPTANNQSAAATTVTAVIVNGTATTSAANSNLQASGNTTTGISYQEKDKENF